MAATAAATVAVQAQPAMASSCPNEAVRAEQHSTYLPDCRGFELATPVNKDGEEAAPPTFQANEEQQYQAAAEGPESMFSLTGGFPGSQTATEFGEGITKGGEVGHAWTSFALPLEGRIESVIGAEGDRGVGGFVRLSKDLSCGFESSALALPAHPGESTPLLAKGETAGEQDYNLYRWQRSTETLSLASELKPRDPGRVAPYGTASWSVDGMSQNCNRVAFEFNEGGYEIPLNAEETKFSPEQSIFEWSATGGEKLASVVPAGEEGEIPATGLEVMNGGEPKAGEPNFNAVSEEGSNLFFTANAAEPGIELEESGKKFVEGGSCPQGEPECHEQVFDRYEGKESIQISRSQTKIPDTGAKFLGASANGQRVFFLANYGLASNSSTSSPTKFCDALLNPTAGCDLYEYHFSSGHPGEGTLTDLSADERDAAEGANAISVAGIANSGEYVYFAAYGQLIEGKGATEKENVEHHTADLYAYHAGHLSYVAKIEAEEAGSGRAPLRGQEELSYDAFASHYETGLQYLISRVSPDGQRLLFASIVKQPVVGLPEPEYNNIDTLTGKPDPELYEYHYTEGAPSNVCVSCQPEGHQPIDANGDTNHPFFAAQNLWVRVDDGVMPINLLNDGRVFFNSFTPLVGGASNSTHPYEFQPNGYTSAHGETCEREAGCISLLETGTVLGFPAFVEGASENGENVFIITPERLAAQDKDGVRDLYDVREGGGEPAQTPAEKCNLNKDECQGENTEPIGESGVGSNHEGKESAGSKTEGPTPGEIARVKVLHKTATSRGVTVTFKVGAAGFVRLSGPGLKTAARYVGHEGTFTLKASYSKATSAALRKHRHPRIKLTLLFRPLADVGSDSSASWTAKA